jgi:NCS1 family nucleobase:cation symporter-1
MRISLRPNTMRGGEEMAIDEQPVTGHWDEAQLERPQREGDSQLEEQGIAPIPDDGRYGRNFRAFTVWFAPNLVIAAVFTGTLATASFIGLSLWGAIAAILLGNLLGALPTAYMVRMGPRTGMPQLALSRIAFGKFIVLPGILNWLSTVAWDGLNGLFGAEALNVLLHVPFWIGLVLVIAAQGALAVFGYEFIHTFEKWMTVVLGVFFVILTIKVAAVGNVHIVAQTHGANAVGGFILMVTIAAGFTMGYAGYAADYSRYMKRNASNWGIGWRAVAGLGISSAWLEILGLLVASKIAVDQTSAGIYHFLGGGVLGVAAMIAIVLGTVAIDAMDDYTGSLSLQSTGIQIPRPISAVVVAIGGFAVALYMYEGHALSTFTNVVLFSGYWVSPFAAIVIVEWILRKGRVDVRTILNFPTMESGWAALVTLLIGFGVSVPFMNTSIYVGPAVSGPLHGGDIAYYVGFLVAGLVYYPLRKKTMPAHLRAIRDEAVGSRSPQDPASETGDARSISP